MQFVWVLRLLVEIRCIIDSLGQCITRQQFEVIAKPFVQAQGKAVVRRSCRAFQSVNCIKPRIDATGTENRSRTEERREQIDVSGSQQVNASCEEIVRSYCHIP